MEGASEDRGEMARLVSLKFVYYNHIKTFKSIWRGGTGLAPQFAAFAQF